MARCDLQNQLNVTSNLKVLDEILNGHSHFSKALFESNRINILHNVANLSENELNCSSLDITNSSKYFFFFFSLKKGKRRILQICNVKWIATMYNSRLVFIAHFYFKIILLLGNVSG